MVLTMINQEEKRGLVLNRTILKMKIERYLNIHLNLKIKKIAEEEKIELFNKFFI